MPSRPGSAFAKIMRGFLRYGEEKEPIVRKMAVKPPADPDGQALMVTCVDARLSPTQFTSAQSQDNILYIARNAGNFIPPSWVTSSGASTELAALDLVVMKNSKRHVLVCGHSTCKAMNEMWRTRGRLETVASQKSPLYSCFHSAGRPSLEKLEVLLGAPREPLLFCQDTPSQAFQALFDVSAGVADDEAAVTDLLSQVNVLQQCENITTHSFLKAAIDSENLILHALWYNVQTGDVWYFDKTVHKFLVVDDSLVSRVLEDELHM